MPGGADSGAAISPRNILAIDTCGMALSVVAMRRDGKAASRFEYRRRGHVERLMPMIPAVLDDLGLAVKDLDQIAVTTGPGTFTGVRIGLSAARGLVIGTGIPVNGINVMTVMAAEAAARWPDRPIIVAIDARRGQVYAQLFQPSPAGGGIAPCTAAAAMTAEQAASLSLHPDTVLVGTGAALVAACHAADGRDLVSTDLQPDARRLLHHVAKRPDPCPAPPPAPLYLRAPDAKPQVT